MFGFKEWFSHATRDQMQALVHPTQALLPLNMYGPDPVKTFWNKNIRSYEMCFLTQERSI